MVEDNDDGTCHYGSIRKWSHGASIDTGDSGAEGKGQLRSSLFGFVVRRKVEAACLLLFLASGLVYHSDPGRYYALWMATTGGTAQHHPGMFPGMDDNTTQVNFATAGVLVDLERHWNGSSMMPYSPLLLKSFLTGCTGRNKGVCALNTLVWCQPGRWNMPVPTIPTWVNQCNLTIRPPHKEYNHQPKICNLLPKKAINFYSHQTPKIQQFTWQNQSCHEMLKLPRFETAIDGCSDIQEILNSTDPPAQTQKLRVVANVSLLGGAFTAMATVTNYGRYYPSSSVLIPDGDASCWIVDCTSNTGTEECVKHTKKQLRLVSWKQFVDTVKYFAWCD